MLRRVGRTGVAEGAEGGLGIGRAGVAELAQGLDVGLDHLDAGVLLVDRIATNSQLAPLLQLVDELPRDAKQPGSFGDGHVFLHTDSIAHTVNTAHTLDNLAQMVYTDHSSDSGNRG